MNRDAKMTVPIHLGLILDGNRRWAKEHGLKSVEGHRKGYENLKTIGQAALDRGVKYISVYVFSTENWNRSKSEVDYLMKLLLWVSKNEIKEFHKRGIRLRIVGSREGLSNAVLKAIESAEELTENNKSGTLALCLNYGGEQEIVDMVRKIVSKKIPEKEITGRIIEQNLYAPDIPSLDLLIRTSGEQRLSGFMLYRASYAELYFSQKYWPDFSEQDLDEALADYANRQRRFGT